MPTDNQHRMTPPEGASAVGSDRSPTPCEAASTREQLALDFIAGYSRARGFSPTVREVGQALGLRSPSSAAALVDRLIAAGAVRREPGVPRSLVIVGGEA